MSPSSSDPSVAPSSTAPDPVRAGGRPVLARGGEDPHRARRTTLLERLGKGAMVLPAAPVLYRSGDSELAYRPDSELLYTTGWREPESVAVLRGFAQEDRFVLFVRNRDAEKERWDGSRMGPAAARDWSGADATYPIEELEARLPKLLAGSDRVYSRLGRDPLMDALVVGALTEARRKGARTGAGPRGIVDPGMLLDPLRLRKDDYEVALLRAAAGITADGLMEGMAAAEPGMGEWVVQAVIEGAWRRAGADGPGFGTIVGSGPNACVLHYRDNARVLQGGEMVLVDCGAEYGDYSGDITRTFPVSGRFSGGQRELYDVVEGARARAVQAVRPGATIQGIHDLATRVLVEGLVELGLLSGTVDDILEQRSFTRFFPHRTSHWLGLDVHDPGDYVDPSGDPLPLEPGMVLTVEPGLYIPPGSPGGAAPFAGMGVRIEDDVLVTAQGGEILGPRIPSSAPEVEALVRG
jgi:Xaa-Pro aminopeptidase